ncbi:MAG: rod shape-determining protein [Oscillospiraceae bacterium]|nr:rod shape-determining protein [Oscillospiraceae bacterium]
MDIGIDLGTANMVVSMNKAGVVLSEPSVVAYHRYKKEVVAVGTEAYDMIGRTPEYITIVRPLADGVISDDSMAEVMIKAFIIKVLGNQPVRPRIALCIPSFITDIESRAVIEAAVSAGSRKVYLIQEPIAALLGAGVDISQPKGNMVVDIGGGTTDIAVVSLNGIVVSHSVTTAGNKLDQSILKYISNRYKLLIGEKTAENIKKKLANVYNPSVSRKMKIGGKNLFDGMPQSIEISELDVHLAVEDHLTDIIEAIRYVFEQTPPELIKDIYDNGIILTGGGAGLGKLDMFISSETGLKCRIPENAEQCVARGTAMVYDRMDTLLDGFEHISLYK